MANGIVAPGGGASVPQTYGPDPVTGFSYSCDPGSSSLHFGDVSVWTPSASTPTSSGLAV